MVEVDLDRFPLVEPERGGTSARADLQEALDGDHVAAKLLPAGRALDLPQLLQRVDPHVRVGPDAERDLAREQALERREPVAEVRLGRGAEAHARAGLGEEVELAFVGVRPVDDRRARPEAAGLRQQLDRPQPVLGHAFLDLARLLVGVDVEDEPLAPGVGADLLEPLARARADGVGGEPDARARAGELLDLPEVLGDRLLPEAVDAAAAVRGEQEHELDPGLAGRLDRRVRLGEPDVVELADGRVAGRAHLAVGLDVALPDVAWGQTPGQVQHGLPPRPEVAALRLAAQRALERVAVGVDEAG